MYDTLLGPVFLPQSLWLMSLRASVLQLGLI
jgi:hypothetical protein